MKKSIWRIVVIVLLAVALVWWYQSRGGDAPDNQLAKHFENMCDIAGDNVDTPLRGINKMFKYYGKNGPAMLKSFGDTLVVIERQTSDEAHDRRAHQARERIWAPLVRCQSTLERFADAVESDPEARDRADRGFERFGRSLEIIFGSDARQLRSLIPAGLPL